MVTKHALERIVERWRIPWDQITRTLTDILKNGVLMGKKEDKYLIQHEAYVVVLKRDAGDWIIVTVAGPSIPLGWMGRSFNPRESPFQGGFELKIIYPPVLDIHVAQGCPRNQVVDCA